MWDPAGHEKCRIGMFDVNVTKHFNDSSFQ